MDTKIFLNLLERHFELLAIHYRIVSDDRHWSALLEHLNQLYRASVGSSPKEAISPADYELQRTTESLIASHWQLLRTRKYDPPAYLVVAIDQLERRSTTWFSYERGMWMDD